MDRIDPASRSKTIAERRAAAMWLRHETDRLIKENNALLKRWEQQRRTAFRAAIRKESEK